MQNFFSSLKNLAGHSAVNPFIPKFFTCLQEGYTLKKLSSDFFASLTITVLTIPLAMAFAIAAGLPPERGLYTAIVAGFLISLLGGSRFQIGGPTGAFVVIIYDIVQRHSYEGLMLATFIGGVLLILMGLLRFGTFLKFIPFPVTVGLTTGIAVVLFTSQLKDFFGLTLSSSPTDFISKLELFYASKSTMNPISLLIASSTIFLLFSLKRYFPKVPGAIVAVILSTLVVDLFALNIPTIASTFGAIPSMLPSPKLPLFSLEQIRIMIPDAITIAILAGLESLLSCSIADGMSGYRHKSNAELLAQGVGNIFSVLFGGMPATGAISRTATNIKMGAKTPLSGMFTAIFVFLTMLLFAPFASKIPLATLAGILMVIAFYMAEFHHVAEILKGPKGDALLFLTTFILTVLIDITVAVEIGVLLAALFFMKRMADTASISRHSLIDQENDRKEKMPHNAIFKQEKVEGIELLQINGPLFFGASDLLSSQVTFLDKEVKIIILTLTSVPMIDLTGIKALQLFYERCHNARLLLLLAGVAEKVKESLQQTGFSKKIGKEHIFSDIDEAMKFAKKRV